MGPTLSEAIWLLPAVLPISLFVAYSDLSRMKIPNLAVYALALSFLTLGFFALPTEVWAWRLLHLPVVLVVGILLNALGVMGAGDAKFMAAAAPFVALQDISILFYLLAGCAFAGFVTHRLAMWVGFSKLVPHWESWSAGKRFPFGFPLAATLIIYMTLPFWIAA